MSSRRPPRLVARFAVGSLFAFMAVGAILAFEMSHQIRAREESSARFHAQFVVQSILAYQLRPTDLSKPLPTSGARYQQLLGIVRARVLQFPAVRVKVWSRQGTVLFSDEPQLVGRSFTIDDDLIEAFAGKAVGGVTDLTEAENVFERPLAPKLLATYVPLILPAGSRGAPIAVVEIYQDYAGVQRQVDHLFRELAVTLLVALGALYLLLLPILRRAGKTMSVQNARLEEQAGRLEALLVQEQHTVSELRELNRLKDEFVAIASHEVRTPLTSIIGYAKTLRRGTFADDRKVRDEFLDAIERQGDRLNRLVVNLLESSHFEGRHVAPSGELVDLADVVREVVSGLGPAGSRVIVDLPKGLPSISSDRHWVELLVSNLLDNALKFSSSDSQCEIAAERDGDTLVVRVRDQGVGIPQDELDRIFDRFYQVDSSATRHYGGVGLGLSLVRNIVHGLEGTVTATSALGQGSTFTVRLPIVPIPRREVEPEPVPQSNTQPAFRG